MYTRLMTLRTPAAAAGYAVVLLLTFPAGCPISRVRPAPATLGGAGRAGPRPAPAQQHRHVPDDHGPSRRREQRAAGAAGEGSGTPRGAALGDARDGGQNEIGAELFDALAVLRTEELLAAHRLDGAEQYFTRAVDFGYSFSQEETFARWGREEVLDDFVRIIRTVRPDVISAMSPEGQFGGQHHQASAILAQEAYAAAADPARFPEQIAAGLRPWQAAKFYFRAGFPFGMGFGPPGFFSGPDPDPALTTVDLGGYDPLLGRTYVEIGSRARSMHKCQGMSQLVALPAGGSGAQYRLAGTTLAEPRAPPGRPPCSPVSTRRSRVSRAWPGPQPPQALNPGAGGAGALGARGRSRRSRAPAWPRRASP